MKLSVRMLGGFSMTMDGATITLGQKRMTKAIQLLQILFLHMESGISKEELMEDLYGFDDIGNLNNSLNNLIYRLKKQLTAAGFPQQEYIIIDGGVCYWRGDLEIEVDAALFEQEIAEAEQQKDLVEKETLYISALERYNGELLPQLSNESWVAVKSVQLKNLYTKALKTVSVMMMEHQQYQQLLGFYNKAAEMYPFEEWQISQMEVMNRMELYDEAREVFHSTMNMYSEEGLQPTESMRERMRQLSGQVAYAQDDFHTIQMRLKEEHFFDKHGAYFCPYPSFVDTYRYVCRTMERSGQTGYLMMVSLRFVGSPMQIPSYVKDDLAEAIGRSLRRGDLYCRYSNSQFLVLLPGAQREDCDMIFNRISKRYFEVSSLKKFNLQYEVEPLEPLYEQAEPVTFKKKTSAWGF